MEPYSLQIKLTVLGPFLTAATSSEVYGLDKTFYRNSEGLAAVPSSHVKGRLRMALHELIAVNAIETSFDLAYLFGQPSLEGSYIPAGGLLHFSDLTSQGCSLHKTRIRTSINAVTLTADEHFLRDFEDLFPSGVSIEWHGKISYLAASAEESLEIARIIRMGFIWLTALGAEKGTGSGRLCKVVVSQPVAGSTNDLLEVTALTNSQTMQLRINPEDRILIGGVKKPRANFVKSERIISGGTIKGALAASLNKAHNISRGVPLSAESGKNMPGFELLAENFDKIRVSHAFPVVKGGKRPVKVPLSTATIDEELYYDMALSGDDTSLIDGRAPAFMIDWKNPKDYFGMASPKEVFVTRTSNDETTRRSLEGQLFTYTFLCNKDYLDRDLEWVSNAYFGAIDDNKVRQEVMDQFAIAVSRHLCNLGKLSLPVSVKLLPDIATPVLDSFDLLYMDLAVVTLQTDAIMLDPQEVGRVSTGHDLFDLYSTYWKDISGQHGESACFKLIDFFASQTFLGGYLYHRFHGAGWQTKKANSYYPYYLTEAGSVFVLQAVNPSQARSYLSKWLETGLDLPGWAFDLFTKDGRPMWKGCPFVPQNGFGEITVNLKWHWTTSVGNGIGQNITAGGEK